MPPLENYGENCRCPFVTAAPTYLAWGIYMIIADWKEFFAAWKTATHATPQTVTQKDVALSPPVASSPSAKPAVGPIKIGTYKAEAIYTVIILKADGKGFFKGQTNQELKWKQTGSELVLKIYGEEDSLESKTYKAKVLSSKSFALGGLKYVILSPPVASSPSAKPTEDRKDPYEKLLKAVKKEPMGLECVPEELKTSELCFAAVKSHGFALEFVPERLKTPELCLLAVQNDKDPLFFATSALQFVPEALKTPELCLAAVKNHKYALEHVPDALKTSELCLLAVQNLGYAL